VEKWEKKAPAFLGFLRYLPELGFLHVASELVRLKEEAKGWTKGVEVFVHEVALEKPLYLVLSGLNERSGASNLRGIVEAEMGSYHVDRTH